MISRSNSDSLTWGNRFDNISFLLARASAPIRLELSNFLPKFLVIILEASSGMSNIGLPK